MSLQDPNLQQKALYWGKRKNLREKIQQMDAALAAGRTALLEGQIPAARPLYLEAQEAERTAQQLADETQASGPAGRVAAAFTQAIQEKLDAIVQGDLIDTAKIRMQFQAIAEIEQALTGGEPIEAPALLRRALFEKSEQASKQEQFDRAEEYLDQMLKIDPTSIQARIELADVLLQRARYARSKAGDGEAALLFIGQATAAYERVKDASEFAGRRGDFESELGEERDAAYFAAGKQARTGRHPLRARRYFNLVPAASPYGSQAREQITAIWYQFGWWAALGIALFVALGLTIRFSGANPSLTTPTAVAQGETASATTVQALLATTVPLATSSIAPSPIASISASTVEMTPESTSEPTPESTIAPTVASTPPSTPAATILIGRITNEGVAVYKTAERNRADLILILPQNTDWYLCSNDPVQGSYLISSDPCDTGSKPLGWINQRYVAPRFATPTPAASP